VSLEYTRGPYICTIWSPEEALTLFGEQGIRRFLGPLCEGCGCYHPCGACGNNHCGCPGGKTCVATMGLEEPPAGGST
jgi:hypothetical protein